MTSQHRKEHFPHRARLQPPFASPPPSHSPSHALMVGHVPPNTYPDKAALAAHADARALIRLVQCSICSRPFSAPVTLPCGHTVCRPCLPEPVVRANISYPNTPDRLLGITCPVSQCATEHASAECNVDVTLAKLMELIQAEIAKHIPLEEDAPIRLDEVRAQDDDDDHENDLLFADKEKPTSQGNSSVLPGGRLVSTFLMAGMGELHYTSEVNYTPLRPGTSDDCQRLDNALLARLRDVAQKELDCLVCYNIMLDPATTPCGHTLCRRCLVRTMDHNPMCPVCRQSLHMPASLHNKPSNLLLNALLNGLCPDLVDARLTAVEAEEQIGVDALNTPLFVCTLSLPAMPTFLHVFEPRYRLMMRRCYDGDRKFGMVMYNRNLAPQGDLGPTQFLEYGTLLEIVSMEILRDGRSFIETRGVGRFKIRAHGMLDGYNVARVERVEDMSLDEEQRLEQSETNAANDRAQQYQLDNPGLPLPPEIVIAQLSTQELLDNSMAFVCQMRNASAPWLSRRIVQVYGEPPEDPALFPYWFASVLPIAEEEKYVLLRTTRVRERLKIVNSWISRIRGQSWLSGSACRVL